MSNTTEDEVRLRAFAMWRDAGEPHGQMDTFWYLAEKELLQQKLEEDAPRAPSIVPG